MYQYPLSSDYSTGLSMLVPFSREVAWTALREGEIFNARPEALSKRVDSSNKNAVTTTTTAIKGDASPVTALLTSNSKRRLLILQNNSTATVAGDTAPTFYIGFGEQAQIGVGVGLPPGVGIVLDVACPIDAIYIAIGPFVNTGGSVDITGAAVEGVTPAGI